MIKVNCLNPISKLGTGLFNDNYEMTDDFADADVALVRSAAMHDLDMPESLIAVARAGAGVNNIPLDKCAEKGIVVFNTPGANANGVKELVFAGMLLAARDVVGGINWCASEAGNADIAKVAEKQKKNFAGTELAGKKIGDEVVFNPAATCDGNLGELGSMLNLERDKANVQSNFKMTISDILVNQPAELNQEFFDIAFGKDTVKSEEEFKAKLKEDIAVSLKGDSNYRFTVDAQNALVAHVGDLELPDAFLKKFFASRDEKTTPEKIEEDYPKMKPQLIWQLAKDKIAQAGEVKVEEDDILKLAKLVVSQQFTQYGIFNAPEEVIERQAKEICQKQEYRRDLANRAVDDKIYAYIQNTAKVDNKNVSIKEFNALFETAE